LTIRSFHINYGIVVCVSGCFFLWGLFLFRDVEAKPAYEIRTTASARDTGRNKRWHRNWDTALWSMNTFDRSREWLGREVCFDAVGTEDCVRPKRIECRAWSVETVMERWVCKGQTVTMPVLESRRKLMWRG
jgi:hypothetical protein